MIEFTIISFKKVCHKNRLSIILLIHSNSSELHLTSTVTRITLFHVRQDIYIRLSGKFVQLVSKRISETLGFCHSIEGAFLLRYTSFGPIGSFPVYEKKFSERCVFIFPKCRTLSIEQS